MNVNMTKINKTLPSFKKPSPKYSLSSLIDVADRAVDVMDSVRGAMLAPNTRKSPPELSAAQLCAICGIEKGKLDYRMRKGDLPAGYLASGNRRRFTIQDARTWAMEYRKNYLRPDGAEAVVITVANFKGGVTKTTTSVTLAQCLSLRGHRVLIIDMDPQFSSTTLFGLSPDFDFDEDMTVLPLCLGTEMSIQSAIQPTYWPGIDIVAANTSLHAAEFALPGRQKEEGAGFEFWNVLHKGIDAARLEYDTIILDTSPSLSYLTINALLACDGLIMPLPPSTLDFSSSIQFWRLFNDLVEKLVTNRGKEKFYDFVDILLARVDANDASSSIVRGWITQAYGNLVLPVEIPKTSATSTAGVGFGTVYDTQPGTLDSRTYRRAFDAYERVGSLVEEQIIDAWKRQIGA
jgi:chromosome partitioning protein